LNETAPALLAIANEMESGISTEEVQTVIRVMGKIQENIKISCNSNNH